MDYNEAISSIFVIYGMTFCYMATNGEWISFGREIAMISLKKRSSLPAAIYENN
jgi:hypothetical protein